MSLSRAPKIDPRNANDVAQQLEELLKVYAPAWSGVPKGVSAALIGVSARFAEVLIQRLNQVPQKNFLSFLQLLGAALLPPLPARAPVTFLLAKGSLVDAVVPVGTQVAAPPSPGENDPVIYETENELVATSAELALAFARDPEEDTYADYSDDIIATGSSGTPVFHGNQQIGHILYLGQSQFLNSPAISSLRLVVDLRVARGRRHSARMGDLERRKMAGHDAGSRQRRDQRSEKSRHDRVWGNPRGPDFVGRPSIEGMDPRPPAYAHHAVF